MTVDLDRNKEGRQEDNRGRETRGDIALRRPQTSCFPVRNLDWKKTKQTKNRRKRRKIRKSKKWLAQVAIRTNREKGLLQPSARPAKSTSSTGHWSLVTGPHNWKPSLKTAASVA